VTTTATVGIAKEAITSTVPLDRAGWEISNVEDSMDKFPDSTGKVGCTQITMVPNPSQDCVLYPEQITTTRQTTRQDLFLIVRTTSTRCHNTKILDITTDTNSNINLGDHIEEA